MEAVVLNTRTVLDMKLISAIARELGIEMLTINKEEQEQIEDLRLLSFMQDARREGLADTKDTLAKLGIE